MSSGKGGLTSSLSSQGCDQLDPKGRLGVWLGVWLCGSCLDFVEVRTGSL